MNMQKQIDYWLKSAEHDIDVARSLFLSKKYDWCLFIGHLVIEKTLKAFYVKENQSVAPKTHLLHVLAKKTGIKFTNEQIDNLKKINEFNIETRYPDIKHSFYELCTKEFTKQYFTLIEELYIWLRQKI